MGYDRGDSFPFDFEPNGSKSKGKRSPRSYPIQWESKCKYSFIIVRRSSHLRSVGSVAEHDIPELNLAVLWEGRGGNRPPHRLLGLQASVLHDAVHTGEARFGFRTEAHGELEDAADG